MNGHNTRTVGIVNEAITKIVNELPQENEYGCFVMSQETDNGVVIFTYLNKNPITGSANITDIMKKAVEERFK